MNKLPTTLVLVPTQFELEYLKSKLPQQSNVVVELCGFGPIVPAAQVMRLISTHQPNAVVLVGIAGSYSDKIEIGSAYLFHSVSCYGIGAGQGSQHVSAEEMGWSFLDGESGDQISTTLQIGSESNEPLELLTVCSASASLSDVNDRLEKFSKAVAEDMEGFAVAVACRLRSLPLSIIRGVSNRAGDRNKSNWEIESALDAASKLASELISAQSEGELDSV